MTDTLPNLAGELQHRRSQSKAPGHGTGETGLGENTEPFGPFTCPRCGEPTTDEFYGPCGACRGQLRAGAKPPTPDTGDRVSRRRWRTIKPRTTAWVRVDQEAGAIGGRVFRPSLRSLAALIETAPPEVERFMLSELPAAGDEALADWCDELPIGWEPGEHYLDPSKPVLRFTGPEGRRLEVRMASAWMGAGDWTPAQAGATWELLRSVLGRRFDGAELLASPGATGLEFFSRSIPEGTEWQTVADDVAELVRANSTQARLQIVEHPEPLPALVEYDGRWMYSALCAGLPTGPTTWAKGDPGDQYDPQARGWYDVRWIVPSDWEGLGILPHLSTADGWTWPDSPGLVASGWVSAVELAQARAWGWETEIRQAVTFAQPKGPGPLDKWVRRLQAARDEVGQDQAHDDPTVRELAAGAVRAILVETIGAMWGKPRKVTCSAAMDAELPAGALAPTYRAGRLVWDEMRPPSQPDLVHPEWTATVWARCRARMLDGPGVGGRRTGALHVPAGDVVAIRTDALYLAADPRWPDDGANGRLRHKGTIPGPIEAPNSHGALLRLKREGHAR